MKYALSLLIFSTFLVGCGDSQNNEESQESVQYDGKYSFTGLYCARHGWFGYDCVQREMPSECDGMEVTESVTFYELQDYVQVESGDLYQILINEKYLLLTEANEIEVYEKKGFLILDYKDGCELAFEPVD